jgi:hypothetical protein
MTRPSRPSPSLEATLARGLSAALIVAVAALASPAAAQLSAISGSTSGSSCTSNSADRFCGFSRGTTASSGTSFTSRYAWNVNADVGALSTSDASGTASHNLSFSATAVGGYRIDVTTSRVGALGRISDLLNCEGSADTSGVSGSSNVGLASGTLSLSDPGVISNGGGDTNTPYSQGSSATIFRESNGVAQGHSLTFTWSGSVRSNSCEASIRQGEQNGTTTDCSACGYAGSPARTQASDGHFVTVAFTSLCGNGTVEAAAGEQCDQGGANGSATSCCTAQCDYRAVGQTCRASAGSCDAAETCSGGSGACPADGFASSSTVCRSSAGACDVAETCTGSSASCPGNGFQPSSTVCRPTAGSCDVAESCTGSSAACPADGFLSSSTICRTSAGVCDVVESCTGSGPSCPADGFASSGVCRGAVGPCDVAESCNGAGPSCPSDEVAVIGTTCRASAGPCDVVETCNGVATTCPADGFEASTVECRGVAGVCDVAEKCTGSGPACPGDGFEPSSTVCRSAADLCDAVENCTGSGAACPADGVEPAGTVCRPMVDACDPEEQCDGVAIACPADIVGPDADGDTVCDLLDNCVGDPNTSQDDTDGDGEGDACDACTNVGGARDAINRRIVLQRVLLPTGDDRLTMKGQVTIPTVPAVDPTTNGVRLILESALPSTFLDVVIPGGLYSKVTKVGWRSSPSGTRWVYRNGLPGPANPIQAIAISTSARTPGVFKFTVRGKNGVWPVTPLGAPLAGTLVIDQPAAASGQCSEITFPSALSCRFNRSFSSVTCK